MNGLTPAHMHRDGAGSPPRRSAPRLTALTPPANAHTYTGTEWAQVPCAHRHRDMSAWAHPLPHLRPGMGLGFFVCFVLQPLQRMTLRWRWWCAHAHAHTHSHTHTHPHAHTHAHVHKQTRTHARTHNAHTRTCTHKFKWENYQWPRFKWDRRTAGGYYGYIASFA